jgi:hypothetical protein
MRPPFIRVLPAEVEEHGARGAILLAHIRYRCLTDGSTRVEHDGGYWWRVPLADMADETGLSVKAVRTALKDLGEAVAAKHFSPLSDRSYAYRVTPSRNGADLPVAENGKCPDLPFAADGKSSAADGKSICPERQIHLPFTADALLLEKLEKGENNAGAGERDGALRNSSPQLTPPPKNSHGQAQTGPDGAGLENGAWPASKPLPAWAIPPDPCPKGGNCQGNCGHCGARRQWDYPDARAKRQQANYRKAWDRFYELEREARDGLHGDWWPTRPKYLSSSEFDADKPYYVAGPPAEVAA